MKKMKKLVSLLLATVMIFAMTITAFAAQESNNTITINNARVGETYKAFKMLELSVNDTSNPTAYRYTVAPGWQDFFADDNSSVWGTVLEKDSTGTYFQGKAGIASETAWSSSSVLSAFAEAAAKYVKDNNLTTTISVKAEETKAILNTTESGYYLITSTLGTRAMIDTTPGNVSINEKNDDNTIVKTVKEDSTGNYGKENDAQVGDTVEFKSVATIVPRSINVKIHDTMDAGLTLNPNSIKVYTDEALKTEYTDATIRTGNNADAGDTFTIDIPDGFASTAENSQNLYIVYTAEVNSNAIVKDANGVAIVDQENKTKVTYGDKTSTREDKTKTSTHKFSVFKHATDSTDNLANAVFQLKKNGTVVNLVKLDANNYRVVDDTETGVAATHVAGNNELATVAADTIVSDFVTVANGDIVIWGVDSDSDYTLKEIQAPKGYNLLSAEVKVTVNSDNATRIDVENKTGIELPSTGGMGTTIFYVLGTILVLGAGVLLITRKRMSK